MSNAQTVPATGTHPPDGLSSKNYKMIDALGHQLRVYDEGPADAPTLVMFHGAPHNSLEFRFNVPALVRAGYRVVIPEHLGAGGSDRPENTELYAGHHDYARALAVVDALGIDKFYVEGGDRGSLPLWMLAALNPERVLGLISENVSHLNGFFIDPALDQRKRSWYMSYFQFEAAEEALRADDWALAREFFDWHPDMEHIIADWERPNGLQASWLNWYHATVNPDAAPKAEPLPDVTVPVLQLYSMNDPYIGPEQLITGREFIKGPFTLKRIGGAGHFIARNAPDVFNREVIKWLGDRQSERRGN
ncbi:alpha/beta fold hydrolase [Streptomyces sp. NPDC055189]